MHISDASNESSKEAFTVLSKQFRRLSGATTMIKIGSDHHWLKKGQSICWPHVCSCSLAYRKKSKKSITAEDEQVAAKAPQILSVSQQSFIYYMSLSTLIFNCLLLKLCRRSQWRLCCLIGVCLAAIQLTAFLQSSNSAASKQEQVQR